jgi:hypothetical protein
MERTSKFNGIVDSCKTFWVGNIPSTSLSIDCSREGELGVSLEIPGKRIILPRGTHIIGQYSDKSKKTLLSYNAYDGKGELWSETFL